jgi:hypothetical protein
MFVFVLVLVLVFVCVAWAFQLEALQNAYRASPFYSRRNRVMLV